MFVQNNVVVCVGYVLLESTIFLTNSVYVCTAALSEMVKDYLVHVGRDLDDGDRTWVFLDRPDFVHADVTSTEQATPPPSFGSVVGTSTTTAPRPLPGAAPLVHGEMPGPSTPPWPASFMETFVRGSSRQDDMSADTAVRGSLCSTVGGSTPNRRVSRDPQPKAEAEATIAGAAASIPTVQKTSFRPGKVGSSVVLFPSDYANNIRLTICCHCPM